MNMLNYNIQDERGRNTSIELEAQTNGDFNILKLLEAYRKIDEFKMKEKIKNKSVNQQTKEKASQDVGRLQPIEYKK